MSKPSFASEKVMRNYLDALLIEDEEGTPQSTPLKEDVEPQLKPVAKLLEKVNVIEQPEPKVKSSPELKQTAPTQPIPKPPTPEVIAPTITTQKGGGKDKIPEQPDKLYRKGEFQALFFDVAGLTVAVPLTELGGIHNMGKLNSLIGKPDWFMGVMVHRDQKLNIVNTAKWVMPEKYDIDLENSIEYQYIIMLDNSNWGLACEKLVNTVTLNQDDVKWKEQSGRRPWLAGLIKERMCALLDVSALIEMLDNGLSTQDEVSISQTMSAELSSENV